MDLIEVFKQPANLVIVGAAMSIMLSYRKAFPRAADHHISARLEPFMPIALCIGFAFVPREGAEAMLWGDKLILGSLLGMGTLWAHKTYRQAILGKDERIAGRGTGLVSDSDTGRGTGGE